MLQSPILPLVAKECHRGRDEVVLRLSEDGAVASVRNNEELRVRDGRVHFGRDTDWIRRVAIAVHKHFHPVDGCSLARA